MLNLIDKIGDWNPQLFRELKGRCKKPHIILALLVSIIPQLLILLLQFETNQNDDLYLFLWRTEDWKLVFMSLNIIFIFTLLVTGSYLIINDLVKEERDGTLNFIRLSPQSEMSIFIGKMLGVPALIYLMVIAAIPFHIFAGISAKVPFGYILYFYLTVIASCILFYSLASLFAIFGGSDFRVSKAWFFCGSILFYLLLSFGLVQNDIHYFTVWLRIFSPVEMHYYLFSNSLQESVSLGFRNLRFLNLPVGSSPIYFLFLCLANYAIVTYWTWEGLKRCFRNPDSTLLGKWQSYFFVGNFNLIHVGFLIHDKSTNKQDLGVEIIYLYMWNIVLFLFLIALISPHRQAIQDWATFRLQKNPTDKPFLKSSLISELITDEKSPATLAIAINLLITIIFTMTLILFKGAADYDSKNINLAIAITICIAFFTNLIIIYATIAQIMLMLKTSKRNTLAIGMTFAAITLPIIAVSILGFFQLNTSKIDTTLWFFTLVFPYGFVSTTPIKVAAALVCQVAITGLLNWSLFKQVQKAGESATKAMFTESKG